MPTSTAATPSSAPTPRRPALLLGTPTLRVGSSGSRLESANRARRAVLAGLALLTPTAAALAVDPEAFESFASGTLGGWGGGSAPTLVSNGGPSGAFDAYVRISSGAGGSPNLALTNSDVRWTGNYQSPIIIGMEAAMANFGQTPVSMRWTFFNTNTNRYSTTDVAVVPADGQWRTYQWLFSPYGFFGLQQVQGTLPVEVGMTGVSQISLRHNVLPAPGGDAITASLGVDNIRVIPFIPAGNTATIVALSGVVLLARRRR